MISHLLIFFLFLNNTFLIKESTGLREFSRKITSADMIDIVSWYGEHHKMSTQIIDHETKTRGKDLNKAKYVIQVTIFALQSFVLFVCLFFKKTCQNIMRFVQLVWHILIFLIANYIYSPKWRPIIKVVWWYLPSREAARQISTTLHRLWDE